MMDSIVNGDISWGCNGLYGIIMQYGIWNTNGYWWISEILWNIDDSSKMNIIMKVLSYYYCTNMNILNMDIHADFAKVTLNNHLILTRYSIMDIDINWFSIMDIKLFDVNGLCYWWYVNIILMIFLDGYWCWLTLPGFCRTVGSMRWLIYPLVI